jgi:hypothetical protein
MEENASEFPPNSDTTRRVKIDALDDDSLEVAELVALLEQAARDVHAAQDRAQRAIAHEASHPGPRAFAARRRAHDALGRARLRRALLCAFWDSGGRERELVLARFEHAHVRRDGVALVRVLGKRARWRTIAFSPATWRLIVEYHQEHAAAARVPAVGPVFPGARPGEALSLRSVERALHQIATRAGIQRLVHAAKRSHRYHVTLKALRELAEAHLVFDLGWNARLAARVHDHSQTIQDRHYLRGRSDAAARAAIARAHVHAA